MTIQTACGRLERRRRVIRPESCSHRVGLFLATPLHDQESRAMACHPVTDLADLTLGHLRGVVGRTFRALDAEGRPVGLKLLSVTDMRPRRRFPPDTAPSVVDHEGALVAVSALGSDGDTVPVGRRRIGLLFRGPDRPRLPDDRYDLELPWLPLPGLHLSPLESDADSPQAGILYEAVID